MPDDRQSHPICDVVYVSPDASPYAEVTIQFNQKCKPEQGLIKLLEGINAVREVVSSPKRLVIRVQYGWQNQSSCKHIVLTASGWVYNRGCAHGTPQPKL